MLNLKSSIMPITFLYKIAFISNRIGKAKICSLKQLFFITRVSYNWIVLVITGNKSSKLSTYRQTSLHANDGDQKFVFASNEFTNKRSRMTPNQRISFSKKTILNHTYEKLKLKIKRYK
jgi:hypothetical protein